MEHKEAAQRSPKGQSYNPPPKQGGVEYKNPQPGPDPHEEEQVLSILNEKGQEIPDPVPMEPPLGYSASAPSLADFVHRMIHTEVSRRAAEHDYETFEESDDFDIEDDPVDPLTPYEEVFMPKPTPSGGGGGAEPPSAGPAPEAPLPSPPASTTTTPNEKP